MKKLKHLLGTNFHKQYYRYVSNVFKKEGS